MSHAIVVQSLSKQFRRYHHDRPWTLQEAFLRGLRRMQPVEHFWALRDVSFSVAPGRMVGVVGRNGAGKSTLLRLIGGVGQPDQGRVEVRGRMGALLDLGAGFHHDLTGRENVFVSGVIAGLTRREVARQFDSIVAFSELQEFIDSPLRTYSTGMQMRLAFAIAVHVEPEILLIDEVLSVGDLSFERKCLDRIAQFKAKGCTIILVSHDTTLIRELCDEALWLRAGRLAAHDAADVVVSQYIAEVDAETRPRAAHDTVDAVVDPYITDTEAETRRRTPAVWPVVRTLMGTELRINETRVGSLELEITTVCLLDRWGAPVTEMNSGDPLRVAINYLAPQPIRAPIFTVAITREDDFVCYDTSTEAAGLTLPTIQGQGQVVLHLERLDLNAGLYYVDVGVYEGGWAYAYDYHRHVYPLIICSASDEVGVLRPPHRWEMSGVPELQAVMSALKIP